MNKDNLEIIKKRDGKICYMKIIKKAFIQGTGSAIYLPSELKNKKLMIELEVLE